jgi:hypothetical protein
LKTVNATASFALALVFALTAALGIAAAVEAPPSLMSRADRIAALQVIERDARLGLAQCRLAAEPAERAICRARVRAAERIAVASLEARYRGTVAAHDGVLGVRARAAHSVEVARRLLPT